ncbi:GNAT family N-acetyltransferase [Massilia sp. Leaf139]|uniref:GNAT family N-acetyltransferase n=1 Tax=Massilia sp. Leaf139 TaxID=1736272 RepID=UPI00070072ED|nr:GNAT family N-acetyltransferase [Massilia sp. Leaf139]KQQ88503.1 GCN5 family acetyltransferase [Massilia sp. Leaf139]
MNGAAPPLIQGVGAADLPALFVYLDDHLQDNGRAGTPLFQPMARADSRFPVDKRAAFAIGLGAAVGAPGWRRAWMALDADGAICGHVDLRARPERASSHRCLLGMGVHRDFRRQGLGERLMQTALHWAHTQPGLDWVDLEVLSSNLPARRLYERCGFTFAGELPDLFRIDGEGHGYVYMTHSLR